MGGEEEEGDFAAAACGLETYLVQCIQCDLIVARCFAIVILGANAGANLARLFCDPQYTLSTSSCSGKMEQFEVEIAY